MELLARWKTIVVGETQGDRPSQTAVSKVEEMVVGETQRDGPSQVAVSKVEDMVVGETQRDGPSQCCCQQGGRHGRWRDTERWAQPDCCQV